MPGGRGGRCESDDFAQFNGGSLSPDVVAAMASIRLAIGSVLGLLQGHPSPQPEAVLRVHDQGIAAGISSG